MAQTIRLYQPWRAVSTSEIRFEGEMKIYPHIKSRRTPLKTEFGKQVKIHITETATTHKARHPSTFFNWGSQQIDET